MYGQEWRDLPGGYFADPKVRADYDRRRREAQRFNQLVETELRRLGYHPEEIPTEEDIETAERRAESRM